MVSGLELKKENRQISLCANTAQYMATSSLSSRKLFGGTQHRAQWGQSGLQHTGHLLGGGWGWELHGGCRRPIVQRSLACVYVCVCTYWVTMTRRIKCSHFLLMLQPPENPIIMSHTQKKFLSVCLNLPSAPQGFCWFRPGQKTEPTFMLSRTWRLSEAGQSNSELTPARAWQILSKTFILK